MALPLRRAAGALVISLLVVGTPALAASTSPSPTPTPTPSASGPGSNGKTAGLVTFGVQPAGPTGPDKRPWLYYSVTPGGILTDYVAVQNYSVKPIDVDVYAADAGTNTTGQFTLSEQQSKMVDAGGWITLDLKSSKVTVPPRNAKGAGHVLIKLEMKIPANASPGDHGAGIIASLKGFGRNAQGDVITFNQRVATRVYVRVSGAFHPGFTISALKASYSGNWNPFGFGSMKLHYVVKNTGNLKLGGRQVIHIQGLVPWAYNYKGVPDIPLMLPGGSVTVDTFVPNVFPLIWETVRVEVTALQLPSDLNPYIPVQQASIHVWAIPWTLIATIIVVLLLLWRTIRWVRRPSRGHRARPRGDGGTGPDASTSQPLNDQVPDPV